MTFFFFWGSLGHDLGSIDMIEVFNIRPTTNDKPKMPKLKNNVASSMMEKTRD